jgi:hypothetical protein
VGSLLCYIGPNRHLRWPFSRLPRSWAVRLLRWMGHWCSCVWPERYLPLAPSRSITQDAVEDYEANPDIYYERPR